MAGIQKIRGWPGFRSPTSRASRTARPWRPTRCCPRRARFPAWGWSSRRGFKDLLEIARQSVPAGLRQQLFLGEAGAHRGGAPRPAGARAAELSGRGAHAFRRSGGGSGGALVPRAGHRRHRRVLPARVCQRRARAPHARRDRARASARGGVHLVGGAARVPRVRARGDDPGGRLRQAARGAVRRRDPGARRCGGRPETRRSTS